MTQTLPQQPLHLELTPMQLAAATPAGTSTSRNLATELPVEGQHLLLNPEVPSQMVLQLRNQGNQPLALSLQVDGNFPTDWCQLSTQEAELTAGEQLDAVLTFRIPLNFFENQQALFPGQSLVLDYQCNLHVYYRERQTGQQQVESASFKLHVRPHSLYLQCLPTIYGESDFAGRLLKIFEQAFEPTVHTFNTLWAYLDPLTAPKALLPFLAYWVAWPIDPRWSRDRQRRLIRNAMELYRWRGTRRGLRLYLHLYTDLPLDEHLPEAEKHISIEEHFSEGFVLAGTQVGRQSLLGGGKPYHFRVRLRSEQPNQIDEQLVRTIIDQEKPAFCTYELEIV